VYIRTLFWIIPALSAKFKTLIFSSARVLVLVKSLAKTKQNCSAACASYKKEVDSDSSS